MQGTAIKIKNRIFILFG